MADISDVENAIVNIIGAALYPNGWTANNSVSTLLGVSVKIYRGWPTPDALDIDLAAGTLNISVYSLNNSEVNKTRYPVIYSPQGTISAPTFTAVVNNNTITIAGTNTSALNQYITLFLGTRIVVSYQIQTTDTYITIAQGLQALISSIGYVCSASNGVITVNSGVYMQVILGVSWPEMAELKRQLVQTTITLWCANPTIRDLAGSIIDPALAINTFLNLPDQSQARFRYVRTYVTDEMQKVRLYRRDLVYSSEYATTVLDTGWQVTSTAANIEGSGAPLGSSPSNEFYYPHPPHPPKTPLPASKPIVPYV